MEGALKPFDLAYSYSLSTVKPPSHWHIIRVCRARDSKLYPSFVTCQ